VSTSGWLDFFTNGQNTLSEVAVNANAAYGADCSAIPENFGSNS
jgi:hypothetical protein